MNMADSGRFADGMERLDGARGRVWAETLQSRIARCEIRFDLSEIQVMSLGPSVVALARRSGSPCVLKLLYPASDNLILREPEMLRLGLPHFVRLIDVDDGLGAFVITRIVPGHTLIEVARNSDDGASEIAGSVLHDVLAHNIRSLPSLPTIEETWTSDIRFARATERIVAAIGHETLLAAGSVLGELVASGREIRPLHGDLHHFNFLKDHDDWAIIDPKGVIGDPCLEPAAFIRNPIDDCREWGLTRQDFHRRIEIVSACAGLDADRVRRWSWLGAVLSAIWFLQDGLDQSAARVSWIAEQLRLI